MVRVYVPGGVPGCGAGLLPPPHPGSKRSKIKIVTILKTLLCSAGTPARVEAVWRTGVSALQVWHLRPRTTIPNIGNHKT